MKALSTTLLAWASAGMLLGACSASSSQGSAGVSKSSGSSVTNTASSATVSSQLLSVSDLPVGWSVGSPSPNASSSGCGAAFQTAGGFFKTVLSQGQLSEAEATFDQSLGYPNLDEAIATFRNAQSAFAKGESEANSCNSFPITAMGTTYSASLGPMSFPSVGDQSAAYAISVSSAGVIALVIDVVLFRKGNALAIVAIEDSVTPSTSLFQHIVATASNKIHAV